MDAEFVSWLIRAGVELETLTPMERITAMEKYTRSKAPTPAAPDLGRLDATLLDNGRSAVFIFRDSNGLPYGTGAFVKDGSRAITAHHLFNDIHVGDVPTGTVFQCYTLSNILVPIVITVIAASRKADYVVFEPNIPSLAYFPLYAGDIDKLQTAVILVMSANIGAFLVDDPSIPLQSLILCTKRGSITMVDSEHVFADPTTLAGDSGSGVVLADGSIIALEAFNGRSTTRSRSRSKSKSKSKSKSNSQKRIYRQTAEMVGNCSTISVRIDKIKGL